MIIFITIIIKELLLPVRVIKVDPVTGDPIRDANGFCIKCSPGKKIQKLTILKARINKNKDKSCP